MNPLFRRHIISIDDLNRVEIELILKIAEKLKVKPQPKLLKYKIIASCFFEASTRTRLSFETSIYRLGGNKIGFSDSKNTSLGKKEESFEDTISVISTYVDAIIIRHPKDGAAFLATKFSGNIPVINAGDGSNQHPTQTLLDLFTIKETQGRLENLNIVIIGDLKYSRTVHSLTSALSKFNGNQFFFIIQNMLMMPKYIIDMLDEKKIPWRICSGIKEVIKKADILYMTRLQRERFNSSENNDIKSYFILHANDLKKAKSNMKVLHPLPRVKEISTSVDKTPHAWYFQQARNGIYTRQALLALLLNSRELII